MKQNRKGYLTVEIILGATIAFAIAFLLIEITTKMVSTTEDYYRDTEVITDTSLITSGVKQEIENISDEIEKINCDTKNYKSCKITYGNKSEGTLEINGNTLTYNGAKYELDKSVSNISLNSNIKDNITAEDNIYFKIVGDNIFTGKKYEIVIPVDNKKTKETTTEPEEKAEETNPTIPEEKEEEANPTIPEEKSLTLVEYITNLYEKSTTKDEVNNNGIKYKRATQELIMNDRLGSSNIGIDAGNLRYYGDTPSNYISFNCDTYPTITCERWRIIGVFEVETPNNDGTYTKEKKVKIIRETNLGEYSWDTSNRSVNYGYGINQWGNTSSYEGADLMRLLNPGYESKSINNSLYWNRTSGTCYTSHYDETETCDFTSTGLKNDETKEMISKTKWNTGGSDLIRTYANVIYNAERGTEVVSNPSDGVIRTNYWNGYVALPYVSDIAYTADFKNCTNNINNIFDTSEDKTCKQSWLAKIYYEQKQSKVGNTYYYFLLTQGIREPYFVYQYVFSSGFGQGQTAAGHYSSTNSNSSIAGTGVSGILPVLYLDTNVRYLGGTGISDNPIRISM